MVDPDDPAFRDVCTGFSIQALEPEPFRRFYGYWLDAKQDLLLPPVSAIDPLKLPRDQLPLMMIVEDDPASGRPRIRLAGTGVRDIADRELTGCHVDVLPDGEAMARRVRQCCMSGEPYTVTVPARWCNADLKAYNALALPFGGGDGTVERIVVLLDFVWDRVDAE